MIERLTGQFADKPTSASEMTYIVSGGVLNSTHSLTHKPTCGRSSNGLVNLRIYLLADSDFF